MSYIDRLTRSEYEPTRRRRIFPRVVRAALILTAGLCALLFVAVGLGRVLPQTQQLAFVGAGGAQDTLYLFDVRYGVLAPMAHAPRIFSAVWSPMGDGLLYNDGDWHVATFNGSARNLSATEQLGTIHIPSPNWTRYVSLRNGSLLFYDTQTPPIGLRPVMGGGREIVRELAWSPDNTHIALIVRLSAQRSEMRHVLLLNVASGQQRTLTDALSLYTGLVWSHTGGHIAFIDVNQGVHVLDLANQTQRVYPTLGTVNTLAWSPDARQLAYSLRTGELYLLHLDTGESELLPARLNSHTRLRWSADGRTLAISSGTLVQQTLLLRDMRSGQVTQIPASLRLDTFLGWQPSTR